MLCRIVYRRDFSKKTAGPSGFALDASHFRQAHGQAGGRPEKKRSWATDCSSCCCSICIYATLVCLFAARFCLPCSASPFVSYQSALCITSSIEKCVLLHFHVLTPRGFVGAPKRSALRRGHVRGGALGLGGAAGGLAVRPYVLLVIIKATYLSDPSAIWSFSSG
jgi:hypothetical protein